jgi:hypothetical protein
MSQDPGVRCREPECPPGLDPIRWQHSCHRIDLIAEAVDDEEGTLQAALDDRRVNGQGNPGRWCGITGASGKT